MNDINIPDTSKLLEVLDKDIDIKCMDLREKEQENKMKRIFLYGSIFLLFLFIGSSYLGLSLMYPLLLFLIYQGIVLIFTLPLIFNLSRGATS